jgi:hypothetical protein
MKMHPATREFLEECLMAFEWAINNLRPGLVCAKVEWNVNCPDLAIKEFEIKEFNWVTFGPIEADEAICIGPPAEFKRLTQLQRIKDIHYLSVDQLRKNIEYTKASLSGR